MTVAADDTPVRQAPRRFSAEVISGKSRQLDRVPRLQAVAKSAIDLAQIAASNICKGAELTFVGCAEGKAVAALGQGWDGGVVAQLDGDTGLIGFVVLSRRAVFELCDRSLGGKRAPPEKRLEAAATVIEVEIARRMCALIGGALAQAFNEVVPEFVVRLQSIGPYLLFGASDVAQASIFVLWFDLDFGSGPQRAAVALLQSVITPMRDLLKESTPPRAPPRSVGETSWANEIAREVSRTHVQVSAVLERRQMTLGEIAELRVGSVIRLDATAHSLVDVEGAGATLFRCELGKDSGVLVLSVSSPTGAEGMLNNAVVTVR